MLKVTSGSVSLSGTKVNILSDFTNLVHSMFESGFDKEDINMCVELASKSTEELEADISKAKEELESFLRKNFDKVLASLVENL